MVVVRAFYSSTQELEVSRVCRVSSREGKNKEPNSPATDFEDTKAGKIQKDSEVY